MSAPAEDVLGFKQQAEELKDRLVNNDFFQKLPQKVQAQCLKAEKLYLLTQDEIVSRMGFDSNVFRGLYLLWSSHVHSFPIGFYRIGENARGTGLENGTDKRYITMTMEFCNELIQNASKEHLKIFPGADRQMLAVSKRVLFNL